jgi:endonuclease/exonuclease/phosphatase family metal-dependent hydrolase
VDGIRVGTYNIHILTEGSVKDIAQDIREAGLDVVGLQEVDKNTARTGYVDQAKLLAEELGWYYNYSKSIDLLGGEYGHAVLSKYPFVSYETYQLPSGNEEQRVFSHSVLRIGTRRVNFINAHFSLTGWKYTQFDTLADYVSDLDEYIITGDFNCAEFSEFTVLGGTIVNNSTDCFITNIDGAIDNIIVTAPYTVGKGTMVDNDHSDHNMLYADITF